jgi:hypothetical protein
MEYIKAGIKRVKEFYDLKDHHLFPMWALAVIHYDGTIDETVLEEVYNQTQALLDEGPAGDECLDGYFFDSEDSTLYLYQFKFPSDPKTLGTIEDAREIGEAVALLYADLGKAENLPEARQTAVECLRSVIDNEGKIILRCVTAGNWATNRKDGVLKLVPQKLLKQLTVDVEFLGGKFFLDLEASRSEDMGDAPAVTFDLLPACFDSILVLPSQNVSGVGKGYTATISAFSLADITSHWNGRLFDSNVRRHLGHKTPVNMEIARSLADEDGRKRFWYGHNGISILCDDIKTVEKDSKVVALKVKNPQIVNGCQTSIAIAHGVGCRRSSQNVLI